MKGDKERKPTKNNLILHLLRELTCMAIATFNFQLDDNFLSSFSPSFILCVDEAPFDSIFLLGACMGYRTHVSSPRPLQSVNYPVRVFLQANSRCGGVPPRGPYNYGLPEFPHPTTLGWEYNFLEIREVWVFYYK